MKQTISQRKALAMGKSVKLRGGGMVKKTGVKRFSEGGKVNLGRGSSDFAGSGEFVGSSGIGEAAMMYGAYRFGKHVGEKEKKEKKDKKGKKD